MADKNKQKKDKDESPLKPDPETLHTTDPQENMEGPISSIMQKITHSDDKAESKEEADDNKERHA